MNIRKQIIQIINIFNMYIFINLIKKINKFKRKWKYNKNIIYTFDESSVAKLLYRKHLSNGNRYEVIFLLKINERNLHFYLNITGLLQCDLLLCSISLLQRSGFIEDML
jgi:hypothetical protein